MKAYPSDTFPIPFLLQKYSLTSWRGKHSYETDFCSRMITENERGEDNQRMIAQNHAHHTLK